MTFSVIIPTYDDWERLSKCLNALEEQSLDSEQYEVIVVDNTESGEIPASIELPEWIQFIHEPKLGSYKARNTGVQHAKGEMLAFTDADCIPQKNWLTNAEKRFNRSDCDLVGGKIKIFQSQHDNKCGYLYQRVRGFPQHKNVPRGKGATANLFVKKSVFKNLNGFSEIMYAGGDWDFTLRYTKRGHKLIYDESVMVLHPARTLKAIFKKHRRQVYGRARNRRRKFGYSYFKLSGSHVLHGLKFSKEDILSKLTVCQKAVIYGIDLLKYCHQTLLYIAIFLRLVNPDNLKGM